MWIRWAIMAPLVTMLIFLCISWLFAHRLTAAQRMAIGAIPKGFPYPIEAVTLSTRDEQTLGGWFVPTEDRSKAIVLLHGYTGSRLCMVPRAEFFREQGFAVLVYDARACGESTGSCVTFGYRERHDLLAALRFLKGRGYENIACLGVSQGGATILYAADELDGVRCVICESVYDAMAHAVDRRVRHYTGLPGWLVGCALVPIAEYRLGLAIQEMNPAERIKSLKCPVLVISGDRDDRTWPEDTERLFESANDPKELWMVSGAQHEDLFAYPGYKEKVLSFLNAHMPELVTQ